METVRVLTLNQRLVAVKEAKEVEGEEIVMGSTGRRPSSWPSRTRRRPGASCACWPPTSPTRSGRISPGPQLLPVKYNIPDSRLSGLVECKDFSYNNITWMLQGCIPPHLIKVTVEANMDVANIRQMLDILAEKIAQGTLTLGELNQICARHEGCLERIRDAIGRHVLGEKTCP